MWMIMSIRKPRRSSTAPGVPLQNRFRRLADNTAHFAQWARGTPRHERYRRIEESWRSLARTEDWLLGRVNPLESAVPVDVPRASEPAKEELVREQLARESAGDGEPHRTEWKASGAEPSHEPNQFQGADQHSAAEA
jgi:hypothetical protein